MAALVSTGGLYALADRSDAGHAQAVQALEGTGGALVVVAPVLAEASRLAMRLLGWEAGMRLLEAATAGELLFQPLDHRDLVVARGILEAHADLSLTGALVLAAAERLGVDSVLCLEPGVRRAARERGLHPIPVEG
ncbi:MAG: type II toxin-antitoxin system VapC family toxin [Anaerolineae bacterium]|jgi:predicted nucleic acid-binding protein